MVLIVNFQMRLPEKFLVKADGTVWLVENDGEQHLIDEYDVNVNPGFKESLFSKSPLKFGI